MATLVKSRLSSVIAVITVTTKVPAIVIVAMAGILGLALTGCSSSPSDTVRIVQSNADGTISALNSALGTAAATLTTVDTLTTQLAAAQSDLGTVRAQLISQLNAPTPTPPLPVAPPVVDTPPANGASGGTSLNATAASTVSGLVIDTPVMAKSIDGSGCPVNPTSTFSLTDPKIYIVAKVHGLKKGTTFTASWAGTITHEDTWTSTYNAPQLCVHFYVQPATLNMGAGSWTASLSVPNLPPVSTSFTIVDNSAQTIQPTAPLNNAQPS